MNVCSAVMCRIYLLTVASCVLGFFLYRLFSAAVFFLCVFFHQVPTDPAPQPRLSGNHSWFQPRQHAPFFKCKDKPHNSWMTTTMLIQILIVLLTCCLFIILCCCFMFPVHILRDLSLHASCERAWREEMMAASVRWRKMYFFKSPWLFSVLLPIPGWLMCVQLYWMILLCGEDQYQVKVLICFVH